MNMVRDGLKDKAFFEESILKRKKLIQETLIDLKNNEIKKEQIAPTNRTLYNFSLRTVFCAYSAGYTIEKVREYFAELLVMLDRKENDWENDIGEENNMGPYHVRYIVAGITGHP